MKDRKALLRNLVVGDIFQADGPNGARPPCLVYAVTDTLIKARAITTQSHYDFDRETGMGKWKNGLPVSIGSVWPLPVDIHNILLGLDRKHRLRRGTEETGFTEDERRALLFLPDHHEANRI
jgi:hypothetical protein